ncbi:MAG: hypothetical protein ACLS5A_03890 [Pseudoruminococcus massiliensis]|uniref:hypothetical protein n=1 Tax=Pseudoruminococcus massiliensis TaxID=2086583 RepID=UPI0039960BF8
MIALKGQIKQVQHLSGKLDRLSGGKSDHYTTTANYFDKLIKTISRVVPIVYEESEVTE